MNPKNWKNFLATTILAVLSSSPAWAQTPERINFESNKDWKSSRWYLVGRWISSHQIEWVDGKRTAINWPDRTCLRSPFIPRIEARSNGNDELEILRSGPWMAIEINPVIVQEDFDVVVRKPRESGYCRAKVPLSTSISGRGTDARPVLVMQPTGSRYFGKIIDISILDLSLRADLQLDLLMAYWYARLPNRQATGAAEKLHVVPVAITRLEWLMTESGKWGSHLFLEQSGADWGGESKQNLIVSNWGLGAFYQHFYHVAQGLQLRYYLEYSQFRADDGRIVRSVAPQNIEAHYFNVGLMTHLYFGSRWSLGLEGKYGYPNTMAGRGAKQTNYAGFGKLNYRANSTVTVLTELGARFYDTDVSDAESFYSAAFGIRLDL